MIKVWKNRTKLTALIAVISIVSLSSALAFMVVIAASKDTQLNQAEKEAVQQGKLIGVLKQDVQLHREKESLMEGMAKYKGLPKKPDLLEFKKFVDDEYIRTKNK